MNTSTKCTCIFYDEKEKRKNNGLPCSILKGCYYSMTGTIRKCVCEGRSCHFYKPDLAGGTQDGR